MTLTDPLCMCAMAVAAMVTISRIVVLCTYFITGFIGRQLRLHLLVLRMLMLVLQVLNVYCMKI